MHLRLEILAFLLIFVFNTNVLASETENEILEDLDNLIVQLPNGKLRGKDNGYFYSFESIPYAEPPIGELRFEAPQLYTQKWAGIFDATQEPAACMQWDQFKPGDDKLLGEENCLTVNIYKPKMQTKKEGLSVLILIHGGAFMFGSVTANSHDHFMRSARVMVVKMTYRLGPLGFLSTEDTIIPGNYGLKDQRLALAWIKQNIAYFGGNAESMMVLGFSAGGASVHLQMLQPNFGNYAKVAASFSGTAFCPWVIMQKPRARAFELAKLLNCPDQQNSEQIKKCLKLKPAKEIVTAVRNFLVFGYNPFTTFGPVIESSDVPDAFLTKSPEAVLGSGEFSKIPWLLSYTAQDGGYNAAELLQISPRREELIEELNSRWYDLAPYTLFFKDSLKSIEQLDDNSMALKNRYLGKQNFSLESYHDLQRMYTDVLFKNGVEKALQLHRQHASSPVYALVYDNPADEGVGAILAKRKDIKFGTNHGDDFSLIFQNPARISLRSDEQIISGKFVKMLEDFVHKNTELSFGSCNFVDNVGKEDVQLMFITKDACKSKIVNAFP